MVKKVLLADNSGIKITGIDFKGNPSSLGVFVNESQHYLIRKGLILSTGNAEGAIGPNEEAGHGLPMQQAGDPWLDVYSAHPTKDACRLVIEFIPEFDSLEFHFIFASEEYPEYVNKGVNDIFGFFLIRKKTGERWNLATVPGTDLPVNVDNINAGKNREYYIPNETWDPNDILQWQDNRSAGELALSYQFDGFTALLTAGKKIVPGETYELVFIIADVGDDIYDSAVFLEEKSFKSTGQSSRPEIVELKNALKELGEDRLVEMIDQPDGLTLRLFINFNVDSYELKGDSTLWLLDEVARILRIQHELEVQVVGHTDNTGSKEHNEELSLNRADAVVGYLRSERGVINDMRVEGWGDRRPIADNVTTLGRYRNRRVEFTFRVKE